MNAFELQKNGNLVEHGFPGSSLESFSEISHRVVLKLI